MKKTILEILKLSKDAQTEMSVYRLERIANVKSEQEVFLGRDLTKLLEEMKNEELVVSNENNSIFSITQKGLNYLLEQ